ncbi:MAG: ABC transporter permease subunit [Planctomycetia bacterium]|nr:ABC transporter permease subunit [Planctomycetia bacterium]
MFIGPVFTREFTIAPRRTRLYVARAAYVLALLGLMSIAWLMLTGTQLIRDVGDLARFGMMVFQILGPLQLVVAVFFSALFAASAVSQEKDRRTLILLLLTNLSNSELVLGKLLASLLNVLVLLTAAAPLFMIATLLGGVTFVQVAQVFAVTLASVLVSGSLGSLLALWREKTFQALAMTVMAVVLWIAVWEVVAAGALGAGWLGLSCETWAAAFSPWRAVLETTVPFPQAVPALGWLETPIHLYVLLAVTGSVAINGAAIAMVRVWNPSREAQPIGEERRTAQGETIWGAEHDAALTAYTAAEHGPVSSADVRPARTRRVWDNPVLWREIRTWAYGRRMLIIRVVYLLLFAMAAGVLYWMLESGRPLDRAGGATALVPLFLLSLFLVNAQAVTSLTSERDARALDLLLVTDLTPKEIVFGKLGGVFYNTKEMILLPMLLCVYLGWRGMIGLENLFYVVAGLAGLAVFVAVLGIHAGMNYFNSRSAVATSLGTLFFLFVGVATCMRMMVAFSGSFQAQLQPFLAFTVGGGIGLYVALGARNPSTAIGVASFLCPFATFYAITSFLLNYTLAVFLVTILAYGFMTAAMLVPAIYEFDVATGRTTIED